MFCRTFTPRVTAATSQIFPLASRSNYPVAPYCIIVPFPEIRAPDCVPLRISTLPGRLSYQRILNTCAAVDITTCFSGNRTNSFVVATRRECDFHLFLGPTPARSCIALFTFVDRCIFLRSVLRFFVRLKAICTRFSACLCHFPWARETTTLLLRHTSTSWASRHALYSSPFVLRQYVSFCPF